MARAEGSLWSWGPYQVLCPRLLDLAHPCRGTPGTPTLKPTQALQHARLYPWTPGAPSPQLHTYRHVTSPDHMLTMITL